MLAKRISALDGTKRVAGCTRPASGVGYVGLESKPNAMSIDNKRLVGFVLQNPLFPRHRFSILSTIMIDILTFEDSATD